MPEAFLIIYIFFFLLFLFNWPDCPPKRPYKVHFWPHWPTNSGTAVADEPRQAREMYNCNLQCALLVVACACLCVEPGASSSSPSTKLQMILGVLWRGVARINMAAAPASRDRSSPLLSLHLRQSCRFFFIFFILLLQCVSSYNVFVEPNKEECFFEQINRADRCVHACVYVCVYV